MPLDGDFETVKVLPFIGEDYGLTPQLGTRIFVLGESHYNINGGPLHRAFTRDVLRDGGQGHGFFTKVVGCFYGRTPTPEMRRGFWRTVVFYNFVQESVGNGARIRPTPDMWAQGAPALHEVLTLCRPGFVLVLGKELWANLGAIPLLTDGPTIRLGDGQSHTSRLYNDDVLFFGIKHPAAPGWTYKKWTPWVQAAIVEAVKVKRHERTQ